MARQPNTEAYVICRCARTEGRRDALLVPGPDTRPDTGAAGGQDRRPLMSSGAASRATLRLLPPMVVASLSSW